MGVRPARAGRRGAVARARPGGAAVRVEDLPTTAEAWHVADADDVVALLGSDPSAGLDHAEAARRLEEHGPNRLPEHRERGPLARLLGQLANPLIVVLLAAGLVTSLLGHALDAVVITAVVVVNTAIGYLQEGKAESALAAVRAMLAQHAAVVRDGGRHEIDAADLVPGDVVLLQSGDRVPADLRLVRVHNLRVEESALTGESVPVDKTVDRVAPQAPLGDRTCLAFCGTLVVYGQGRGVVVATGTATEVGRIGALVGRAPDLTTPLTRRLEQLAWQITGLVLVLGGLAFLYMWLRQGVEPLEAFLVVVGMAVAAIPEGLPAVITIILAIGTRVLAANRAIVRRLPAVETLGSVSIIGTDKTGTLTCNEMTVTHVLLPDGDLHVTGSGYAPDGGFTRDGRPVEVEQDAGLDALLAAGVLCNDASVRHRDDGWHAVGDPTEAALVTLALKAGLDRHELRGRLPRTDAIPFESENRYMVTLHHDHHGRAFVFLKGAPERVLALCGLADDDAWRERVQAAAAQGERVLALAGTEVPGEVRALDVAVLPGDLELLGMVGIMDPPRPEAVDSVARCRGAGVRVVMITGDHAVTALAIADQLGIAGGRALTGEAIDALDDGALRAAARDHDVVARASPEHKLRLVSALQAEGAYVAMTGDGVNDAPALKAADIGVAMGGRGTDAARDASDLVLTDDDFATVARAVRQGRVVYDNIKKSLLFILPTNGGEASLILTALVLGMTMPVTVAQILWVNMVTAVTLALALAWEPAERDVMDQPPRPPREALLTPPLLVRLVLVSALMAGGALLAFQWELGRGSSLDVARTAAVSVLVVAELFYLFHARSFTRSVLTPQAFRGNRVVPLVVALLVVLQALFTYAPPFQVLFRTAALDLASWGVVVGIGLVTVAVVEAEKAVWRSRGVHRM
ncbi:MAG: HAD-IC family P-type ATPase [Actinotalea sp.]|nr:HAD-IC family P-type ATPase [Actinotalea sp.]